MFFYAQQTPEGIPEGWCREISSDDRVGLSLQEHLRGDLRGSKYLSTSYVLKTNVHKHIDHLSLGTHIFAATYAHFMVLDVT